MVRQPDCARHINGKLRKVVFLSEVSVVATKSSGEILRFSERYARFLIYGAPNHSGVLEVEILSPAGIQSTLQLTLQSYLIHVFLRAWVLGSPLCTSTTW